MPVCHIQTMWYHHSPSRPEEVTFCFHHASKIFSFDHCHLHLKRISKIGMVNISADRFAFDLEFSSLDFCIMKINRYFWNIFSKFYYHILSLNSASHFSIFSAAYDVFYSLWQNLYSFWETLEISFVILQRETKTFSKWITSSD